MQTIAKALAAGALSAALAAAPAAAHSTGDVLVIRGGQVSKAGQVAARPPRPARAPAALAPAAAPEPARVRVSAEGEVLEVRPLGAGETIWFVDPDDDRLVACQLRGSFKVERQVLRCWSGTRPE